MVMVDKEDFKQVYNQKIMSFYIKVQSIGSCLFVDKYFRLHRHHTDIPVAVDQYPIDPISADTSLLKIQVIDQEWTDTRSVKHDTVSADMPVNTRLTVNRYVDRLLTKD